MDTMTSGASFLVPHCLVTHAWPGPIQSVSEQSPSIGRWIQSNESPCSNPPCWVRGLGCHGLPHPPEWKRASKGPRARLREPASNSPNLLPGLGPHGRCDGDVSHPRSGADQQSLSFHSPGAPGGTAEKYARFVHRRWRKAPKPRSPIQPRRGAGPVSGIRHFTLGRNWRIAWTPRAARSEPARRHGSPRPCARTAPTIARRA